MSGDGLYTCNCVSGYSGKNCETNIDDCAGMPCSAAQMCVDQVNGFMCVGSPMGLLAETDGDCREETFLDLTQYDGPGADYPAATLTVTCDDQLMTVASNGIPHYTFVALTPNALQAQNHSFQIPLQPTLAAEASTIPLLGTVAVTIGGAPIYGPNEAQFPDPYGDPIYNDIVDTGLGHTGGQGDYHHHGLVEQIYYLAGMSVDPGAPSPILAWSLDGFPIYGPRGCADAGCTSVIEYKSGWVQTGDPTTYAWDNHEYQGTNSPDVLDECNGHVGPDGDYHYHATASFPYILGCYSGTPSETTGGGMDGGPGGGGPGGGGPGGGGPGGGGPGGGG